MSVRKWLVVLASALTLSIALSGTAQAANAATVTKMTVPSFFVDPAGNFFPATCHITQVINRNHRKESFQCSFDGDAPAPIHCDPPGCLWLSDIDGALAVSSHVVITPSGHMRGWATYY
jgi:hypothetical protein